MCVACVQLHRFMVAQIAPNVGMCVGRPGGIFGYN